jgi:EAL domain-containing protein (putative c-di-GMP-specific phosphodiesterase class I)
LSRFSGDEFAILLPLIRKTEDVVRVAQRILGAVAEPFYVSEHELAVTCSIGIAVFPDDGVKADTVVKNAGAAMHHVKQLGKNTFQFYSSELNARALQKLTLASELRKALERDELRLYYQPKVDVRSDVICGAEALVRWPHSTRGWVPPDEFIPLAEDSGLIVQLGEWVMRAACRQINDWRTAGFTVLRVAVNVSSYQFKNGRLAQVIAEILRQTGAQPHNIGFELTEGVLIENMEENVQTLRELKDMGVKLSIDDFGTGYSSLSYLHKFPIDELKIDRSFISQIKSAEDRAAIITAIIAMAHSLGLRVVAEGVETAPQLEFLKSQGCDEFQGYLMSKPVAPEEFASRFLAKVK